MPLRTGSASSRSNRTDCHSLMLKLLDVGSDRGVQFRGLGVLFPKCRSEPRHLFLERLVVLFLRLGSDVAAGGEHVAVLANLDQWRAPAEAGEVAVLARVLLA